MKWEAEYLPTRNKLLVIHPKEGYIAGSVIYKSNGDINQIQINVDNFAEFDIVVKLLKKAHKLR